MAAKEKRLSGKWYGNDRNEGIWNTDRTRNKKYLQREEKYRKNECTYFRAFASSFAPSIASLRLPSLSTRLIFIASAPRITRPSSISERAIILCVVTSSINSLKLSFTICWA